MTYTINSTWEQYTLKQVECNKTNNKRVLNLTSMLISLNGIYICLILVKMLPQYYIVMFIGMFNINVVLINILSKYHGEDISQQSCSLFIMFWENF